MPSSVIAAIDYQPEQHQLLVRFVSGALYAYEAVPEAVYRGLREAESKGRYFSRKVRDRYAFRRLD